jgi:hypothetical protein
MKSSACALGLNWVVAASIDAPSPRPWMSTTTGRGLGVGDGAGVVSRYQRATPSTVRFSRCSVSGADPTADPEAEQPGEGTAAPEATAGTRVVVGTVARGEEHAPDTIATARREKALRARRLRPPMGSKQTTSRLEASRIFCDQRFPRTGRG